jgi:hypothetical protein
LLLLLLLRLFWLLCWLRLFLLWQLQGLWRWWLFVPNACRLLLLLLLRRLPPAASIPEAEGRVQPPQLYRKFCRCHAWLLSVTLLLLLRRRGRGRVRREDHAAAG